MIRSLAFNLFFYVFTLLAAVVGVILVPIPTPVILRGLLHSWARAIVWGARWIGGMKVEIRGRDNLPAAGPALLANKHQSESDGIFLAANISGIAFVAMQELFRYPVIGAILYRLQMIRVDACGGDREREHLAQFAKRAWPRQADLHAPAGGRDRDGERPADRRVFRPALRSLAAGAALARPDRYRPAAQRPSRSALTNSARPYWRSRF